MPTLISNKEVFGLSNSDYDFEIRCQAYPGFLIYIYYNLCCALVVVEICMYDIINCAIVP